MRTRDWVKYISLAGFGVLAVAETTYAWLKYHPEPSGKAHWFVSFYDVAKDYRSAYLSIIVFLASFPSIPLFRKIYRTVMLTQKRDRDEVRLTPAEEADNKRMYINQLISRYQIILSDFESNRRDLNISRPVTLRFKSFKKLGDFELDNGKETSKFLSQDFTKNAISTAVVGPPGIGKSYTLLRRITDALEAINQNDEAKVLAYKIPFLFKLGNWNHMVTTDSGDHLESWMEEQLEKDYQIEDKNLSKWLVNNKHIVPILDGLDEVTETFRDDCLTAISKYYHLGRGVILSCRKSELTRLINSHRLGFGDLAVCELLTLTKDDIRREIRINVKAGEQTGLFAYLDAHEDLWEKINAPLILNLFEKTYTLLGPEGLEDLKDKPTEDFLDRLWQRYDEYIFKFKFGKISDYKVAKLRLYAVWMAKLVPGTSFYLDKIQPQWIDNSVADQNKLVIFGLRGLYFLLSRLISAMVIAIGVGLIISEWNAFLSNGVLAGCLVALMVLLTKNVAPDQAPIRKIYDITVLSFILMFACGFFQGISVPRKPSDMHGIFATTESFPGILLGLFSGVIFGYRRNFQTYDIDIKPVERSYFDWHGALFKGAWGGLGIGLLISFFGVLVQLFGQKTTFYQWLGDFNENVLNTLYRFTAIDLVNSLLAKCVAVFLLALIVGGLVGFVIVFILSGRDEARIEETDINKKRKLNYGIYRSGLQALSYGGIAAAGISIVYGLLLFAMTHRYQSFTRSTEIGFGFGLISFLWFGGFEVVQHWSLRLILLFYGVLPLQIGSWVKTMHKVAFLHRNGNNLEFQHQTLKDYVRTLLPDSKSIVNTQFSFIRFRRRFISVVIIALSFFIYRAVYDTIDNRFFTKIYWDRTEQFELHAAPLLIKPVGNDKVIVLKSGTYQLDVEGSVLVGTFVGKVHAEGTFEGFLGVPIGDSYNLVKRKNFRHGALLFRSDKHYPSWETVVDGRNFYWPWSERRRMIKLSEGETLTFMVNDNEYQNDAGKFQINFTKNK